MEYMKIYNVLWTGGLDSTFRIAELSLLDCEIQPYYIIDKGRKSTSNEMKAMSKIRQSLLNKPSTKAKINNVKFVEGDSIPVNEIITNSYIRLKNKYKLGSQYELFARYASDANIILEIGSELSQRGRIDDVLESESMLLINPNDDTEYIINQSESTEDARNLFVHIAFPVFMSNLTKEMEVDWLKEHNFFDIALMTWFCHDPVCGKYPCGHCNPCKDALNEGMEWRVPYIGRILGAFRLYLIKYPRRIYKRIFRK